MIFVPSKWIACLVILWYISYRLIFVYYHRQFYNLLCKKKAIHFGLHELPNESIDVLWKKQNISYRRSSKKKKKKVISQTDIPSIDMIKCILFSSITSLAVKSNVHSQFVHLNKKKKKTNNWLFNFLTDFASSASSSSSVKSDASDKSRGPSSTPDLVSGQHSSDRSPTRNSSSSNVQSAPSTPSTTAASSSSNATTSTTTSTTTTASPRSSSAQRGASNAQQTTPNANTASPQAAGAMSAPTGRQVPKRRMRRRATSQSQDPAEQLTEMSVRGLNLFRYASISEGVYQCTECAKVDIQKTFKNKYSFQRHAFLYHEGHQRKVFPCPVCHKEFSRPDKMKNHMKTVHDCFMPKDCVMPFSFFQLQ